MDNLDGSPEAGQDLLDGRQAAAAMLTTPRTPAGVQLFWLFLIFYGMPAQLSAFKVPSEADWFKDPTRWDYNQMPQQYCCDPTITDSTLAGYCFGPGSYLTVSELQVWWVQRAGGLGCVNAELWHWSAASCPASCWPAAAEARPPAFSSCSAATAPPTLACRQRLGALVRAGACQVRDWRRQLHHLGQQRLQRRLPQAKPGDLLRQQHQLQLGRREHPV